MGFDDRGKKMLSMKVVDQQTGEDLEGKPSEGCEESSEGDRGRRRRGTRREEAAE